MPDTEQGRNLAPNKIASKKNGKVLDEVKIAPKKKEVVLDEGKVASKKNESLPVEGQIASKKNGQALDEGKIAFQDEESLDKSLDFKAILKKAGSVVPTKKSVGNNHLLPLNYMV